MRAVAGVAVRGDTTGCRAPTVTLTGGGVDMLLRGLRAAQVVENSACSPHGTARRNPCLGGGVDYDCELCVTNVSLDGCLLADPAGVAGGVGTGGRDRGSGIFPCADVTQCETYLVCPTGTT